jgi:hypothetical protein
MGPLPSHTYVVPGRRSYKVVRVAVWTGQWVAAAAMNDPAVVSVPTAWDADRLPSHAALSLACDHADAAVVLSAAAVAEPSESRAAP